MMDDVAKWKNGISFGSKTLIDELVEATIFRTLVESSILSLDPVRLAALSKFCLVTYA
jgi:hypothetical protein